MRSPMQRVLGVSSALHALERLSSGAVDEPIIVEGEGFNTLFRLLRRELEDAAGEIAMQAAGAG